MWQVFKTYTNTAYKRERGSWERLKKETTSTGKSLRQKVVDTSQGKASAKPGKLHTGQDALGSKEG